MEVFVIDEKRKPEWEAFLQDNHHAIAWQGFDWSEVVRKHYNVVFYPIAACEGNRIVGVFPLYRVKTAFSSEALVSVPYAVAGGVVSDNPDARRLMLEKAIEISRRHGSCRIVLKQYKIRMDGDLLTDANYHNRELSLSKDIGNIWKKIDEKNRRMVESTGNMKFDLVSSSEDIKGFHRMLLESQHRKGIPCVSRGWIEDLLGFRLYSIALLKKGETVVAGTLVKEYKKTVSFPFTFNTGNNEEGGSFAYRLYWELIRLYAEKGYEIFHSGRIPNSEAAESYRLGWGGERHPYYYQYYPNTSGRTEHSAKRGRKRELIGEVWKKLPVGVSKVLGPYVVKMFP